jgi:RNA polymerase sigma factor (sigma-70 family)
MERHHDVLIYIGRRFLRRTVLLEDFLQDVWMQVLTELRNGTYIENEHFAQWLHTIAYRRAKDICEKEKHIICDDAAMKHAEETIALTVREKRDLDRMLSVLPPGQRKVMQKRLVEEKSVKEAAAELNMTPNAVIQATAKAVRKLKRYKNIF